MKLISWNVNGLRACIGKGFHEFVYEAQPDVLCIQETKMHPGQAAVNLPEYRQYWNSANKRGYSGTAVFSRLEPISVQYGMDRPEHDQEGRLITLEFSTYYIVNCYTPNAQRELTRLTYRMTWEDDFRAYLLSLDANKPVILCGDLNVAHQEIDLKNPKSNRNNAGFTDQERGKMTELLASGFTDSFRYLYPDATGAYSWWSYMNHARKNNAGWRIDYFILSKRLEAYLRDSFILPEVMGSDHCPVGIVLDMPE